MTQKRTNKRNITDVICSNESYPPRKKQKRNLTEESQKRTNKKYKRNITDVICFDESYHPRRKQFNFNSDNDMKYELSPTNNITSEDEQFDFNSDNNIDMDDLDRREQFNFNNANNIDMVDLYPHEHKSNTNNCRCA